MGIALPATLVAWSGVRGWRCGAAAKTEKLVVLEMLVRTEGSAYAHAGAA